MAFVDENDVLDAIAELGARVCDMLETKRGLHKDRHMRHYGAAVDTITRLMAGYFRYQKKAVLAAVEPHILSVIHQFTEAAGGKRFASTLLPVSLQPLRFATTGTEDLIYSAAISTLIA